ncbi:hypothetical protein OQZ33_14865 [Pedobacter sp. MC2016-05]|uniref:hypothetical protein n=1 Tax=Pedobacter sp. MC2016-05 TaxID=2994474 RepID=UPI002246473B|nr:hypothetical protein [Pedobacter sp. MC2016-05]MCX2475612.1 hypothetical protein [Pedobacter sp. MC2016-05]
MKKFLKIAAVILISLLILFLGTLKYRNYSANQIAIPKNTTSLVKISVDEILKTLAFNAISNPVHYFKSDTGKNVGRSFKRIDHGLSIPANLYLYTIKDQPNTSFFARFKIRNLQNFEDFLSKAVGFKIKKVSNKLNYAKSVLGNVAIWYDEKSAAVVFSSQIANFDAVLKDVLNEKDFKEMSDGGFSQLIKSSSHVAFQENAQLAELDFKSGEISFNGIFNTLEGMKIKSGLNSHQPANTNHVMNFWLNADFERNIKKEFKLKNVVIEQDSLVKYYQGNIDMEWINTIKQTDSIITYEYNDDFEKVQKVTLQQKDVPNVLINISADALPLKNYLARQNVIYLDSGVVNKSVFPLYQVFVGGNSKQLTLSTTKEPSLHQYSQKNNNFLALNVNFKQLNRQVSLPIISRYLESLKYLTVTAQATRDKKIAIQGKLEMNNQDINALYQLLTTL